MSTTCRPRSSPRPRPRRPRGTRSRRRASGCARAVAALEKRMIERALARAGGNRSEAARSLGIGRQLLYAKLEEYGIS
ncbi:MAG: helix-turn-helix domain-containing protein [Polyangiales bacterium]